TWSAAALSYSRGAEHFEGRGIRRDRCLIRSQILNARTGAPARLPAPGQTNRGHTAGENAVVLDAALDATGALHASKRRPLWSRNDYLHAFHLSHSTLP